MKHHLILLTILAFATGALAAKPQAPASVARLLAMLDQPPSRAQCIEFNTDDYALHQGGWATLTGKYSAALSFNMDPK